MAIAYDNSATIAVGAYNSTAVTASYTVTGTNTLLVIRIYSSSGNDDVSGVTYAGTSMTQHAKQLLSSGNYIYTYILLGAATGANNIVISKSSTTNFATSIASYTGVKQSGFPDATVSDTGTTTGNITKVITTIADNCWVISTYCAAEGDSPITAGAGNTLRQSLVSGAVSAILDSNAVITPAGNFSSIINKNSTAVRWGRNNFSIAPASTTNIKSLNGLAIASVKSKNGLAIASIKSFNGLS